MRRLGLVVCVALAAGCSGGTDAALTAQDAKSKLAVKDNALARLAQTQLTVVSQQAQAWAASHGGDMTGFADELRMSQPSLVASVTTVTDTSASVVVGAGRCLTVTLPAGSPTQVAC
jgi:hypothetical protein